MLEVAAIVDEALEPLDVHPIVVGGLAVAYWASGMYVTSDIDVVMPYLPEVNDRLEALGFTRKGRFWILAERQVFFEAPGSYLEPSTDGYQTVELASGRLVRIQTAEEVLIVRIKDFLATPNQELFQQCLWMLGVTGLGRERLERRAAEEGLAEAVKALDGYVETVKQRGAMPESWELKELAGRL